MRQTFDSSLDEMHAALLGLLRPHIGSGTSPSKVRQFLTSIRRRGRPCLRSCVIRVFGVVLSVSERGPTASVEILGDGPAATTACGLADVVHTASSSRRSCRQTSHHIRLCTKTEIRMETSLSYALANGYNRFLRIKQNDTSFIIFLDASSRSLRFG